jgi:hypothetical protein
MTIFFNFVFGFLFLPETFPNSLYTICDDLMLLTRIFSLFFSYCHGYPCISCFPHDCCDHIMSLFLSTFFDPFFSTVSPILILLFL